MRTATAHERHRAHHIRPDDGGRPWIAAVVRAAGLARATSLAVIVAGAGSTLLFGCRAGLPRPPAAQVSASDYVAVPYSPRVPPVEYVPPRPAKDAMWVDGSWEWSGSRFGWRYGSWMIPPPNARLARWVVVRRSGDGQLFFAPSRWKDASGRNIDDRSFMYALGPAARARTRPGGPPAGVGPGGQGPMLDETSRRVETDDTVDTGDSDVDE